MKSILAICGCGLLIGCTAPRPPEPPAGSPMAPVTTPAMPGSSSSALLFDPPLSLASAPVDLDRTGRGEAAFVGFEQTTTASFDISTYNRASTDGCDTYDRAACIERVGTLTR